MPPDSPPILTHSDTALTAWIALCGAIGAVSRYGVGLAVTHLVGSAFPLGTLVVNLIGCLAMGLLVFLHEANFISFMMRQALAVGLLGGFTTFSAFGLDTYQLMLGGRWWLATVNIVVQVVLGIAAVGLGIVLGRAMASW